LVSRQRYRFNPQTGLLIGRESWSERKDQPGRTWHRTVVDRIEYGLDLPDSLFSLEIPKGAILKYDYTTPEGLKEYVDGELDRLERMPPKELAKWTEGPRRPPHAAIVSFKKRRDQLRPADRAQIEARFKRLGILK
jgi:hypothetical protein